MHHTKIMKIKEGFWRKLAYPIMLTSNRFYKISGIDKFIKRNNLAKHVCSINQVMMSLADYNQIEEIFVNNPMTKIRIGDQLNIRQFYFYNIIMPFLPTYKESVPAGEIWFEWDDEEEGRI